MFPLLLELALVPIILGFIAMQVVAASNPSQASARKFIDGVPTTIGFFLLAYVAVRAVGDPSRLFARENMETLLIASVMTFAFVPFLWASGWISRREQDSVLKRFRTRYDSTA